MTQVWRVKLVFGGDEELFFLASVNSLFFLLNESGTRISFYVNFMKQEKKRKAGRKKKQEGEKKEN